jgi:hypothetical protein
MAVTVDALRVVQDPKYAASLTDAQWRALQFDPEWDQLVGEYHEMVAPVLEQYAQQLGVPAPRPVADAVPGAAGSEQFQVIGKRVPRLHGLGIVTNIGQYVQNMRLPGMLHTRTLRSQHPHAKIKSINTDKAMALTGVVHNLQRGKLPAENKDTRQGGGPP